jgi:hypothetical protein
MQTHASPLRAIVNEILLRHARGDSAPKHVLRHRPVEQRSLEKRGRIYRTGLIAKGTHRFPPCSADTITLPDTRQRTRDGDCAPPPAQIPASGTTHWSPALGPDAEPHGTGCESPAKLSTKRRVLDSGLSRSASRTAPNILCRLASAQKSPINTGLRAQTSAPRQPGGDPKFALSGRFSPNLWTSLIQYGCTDFVSIWKESALMSRTSALFERSFGVPGATGIEHEL